ncbi:unnamed protein product [Caenorhabditis sp. 36 PRJEB53466]|nr:unnamed protein product [Caenorhabditis sp. 36 PRJEB53466]
MSLDWLQERIHDKKHFTARHLGHVAEVSGMQPDSIATIFCAVSFLILTFSDQAHFFANLLLVGVPLLLVFVYPDEKPSDDSFVFYFPIYGGLTLFDRTLECIPCYYVWKISLFLLFFLPPYTLHEHLNGLLIQKETGGSQMSQSKKSYQKSSARESSTRTAIAAVTSPILTKSDQSVESTQRSVSPALQSTSSKPKSSEVKVTTIEEYYREEELLSPNGTNGEQEELVVKRTSSSGYL